MSYEEFPVAILAREVQKLRNREIPNVKVLWSNHDDREATWELEDVMKEHHPRLFEELKRLEVNRSVALVARSQKCGGIRPKCKKCHNNGVQKSRNNAPCGGVGKLYRAILTETA
uniref:Chromo domain-containing protein n=1 Tax=Ananas comosus var. bracteatus TaxID=296719 RepID=A0A6V7QHE2_ANACO|nr:unnamed protein product [Ananas comosus var. bracteatus]